MPGRKVPLVDGQIYHVYNRGVAKLPTFTDRKEYERAIGTIDYYRFANVFLRYSQLLTLPYDKQRELIKMLRKKNDILVRIHTFKLMPNHFHISLEQVVKGGISKFMANFTNSYTRFVNIRKDRVGPIFQGTFKSVLVKTLEQLLHLSRYQHLNLFTDGLVNTVKELLAYEYSSLVDYVGDKVHDFVDTDLILSHFKTKERYKKFVLSQRDYQRRLGVIKKLTLEKTSNFVRNHL